jgi:hypothetical protein
MRIRNRQKTAWVKSHQREEAILVILQYLVEYELKQGGREEESQPESRR